MVVATLDEAGRVGEVLIHPLDLGAERPLAARGVPAVARGTVAMNMLAEVARLSRALGTEIRVEGETGRVSR